MPVDVFSECIAFFAEHSTYFLYNSVIYRQSKGLAMGQILTQVLAEIVTSKSIIDAGKKFKDEDISCLGKYVDDILAILDNNIVERLEK